MLRDITIGQYYEADSIVHKLDPRVKLFGTLSFMVALFIADNIIGYVCAATFLMCVVKISKVPYKFMFRGIKGIIFLLLISVIFSVFFTPGIVLVDAKIFKITAQGIVNGAKIITRLLLLIMGSSMMTYTTTPTDIADGMEKALSPLSYIKVPIHELAMMVSIAFRFIPILTDETDKIMKAQMARGADFETGGLIKKAKSMVPLMIPLILSALKRAIDLATAMEARCYRGGKDRTKMKPLIYHKCDFLGYVILITLICVSIGTNFLWQALDVDIYWFLR